MKNNEQLGKKKDGGKGEPKTKKKRGCQQCDKLIGLLQQLKGHMEGLKVKADQFDEFRVRLDPLMMVVKSLLGDSSLSLGESTR